MEIIIFANIINILKIINIERDVNKEIQFMNESFFKQNYLNSITVNVRKRIYLNISYYLQNILSNSKLSFDINYSVFQIL